MLYVFYNQRSENGHCPEKHEEIMQQTLVLKDTHKFLYILQFQNAFVYLNLTSNIKFQNINTNISCDYCFDFYKWNTWNNYKILII